MAIYNSGFTQIEGITLGAGKEVDEVCWRCILTLSSHLRLLNGLFPVGLTAKILKAFLPPSILATSPVNLNLLDFMILLY